MSLRPLPEEGGGAAAPDGQSHTSSGGGGAGGGSTGDGWLGGWSSGACGRGAVGGCAGGACGRGGGGSNGGAPGGGGGGDGGGVGGGTGADPGGYGGRAGGSLGCGDGGGELGDGGAAGGMGQIGSARVSVASTAPSAPLTARMYSPTKHARPEHAGALIRALSSCGAMRPDREMRKLFPAIELDQRESRRGVFAITMGWLGQPPASMSLAKVTAERNWSAITSVGRSANRSCNAPAAADHAVCAAPRNAAHPHAIVDPARLAQAPGTLDACSPACSPGVPTSRLSRASLSRSTWARAGRDDADSP